MGSVAVRGQVVPLHATETGWNLTDLELLRAARRGDNRALCDLHYRHGDRLYRVLKYDCEVDHRALTSVLQATFLEIWRPTIPPRRGLSVSGWIVRAAIRAGKSARRSARTRPRDPVFDPSAGRVSPSEAPANLLEDLTPLEAAIFGMPWGRRLAIALIERESMTDVEVSDALGVSIRRVWRWVDEARRQLQHATASGDSHGLRRRLGRLARTGRWCPPGWVLNRAVTATLPARVGWHLSACIHCSRAFSTLTRISVRIQGLPRHEMGARLRNEVTVSLLAAPLAPRRTP
jgi:DNA-directed RNA polymerase specialized sigma24 family protein